MANETQDKTHDAQQAQDGNDNQLAKTQSNELQRRSSGAFGPLGVLQSLSDEMDDLFARFGLGRRLLPARRLTEFASSATPLWTPQIEVFERGDQMVVRADLPGLKKEDVQINVEDDVLTLQGERKDEREEKRDGYFHSERSYGSFYRSIPLPEGVDAEQVKANFKDGVLEVTMPSPPRRETRRRQVEIEG
jgi:HSP20 family protein